MKGNVVLSGMPGCGKSTVGSLLAETTGFLFFDLDTLIEKRENKSVAKIFEINGEAYFRELETKMLKILLTGSNASSPCILSVGGGTIANEENFEILKKIGKIFYLEVSCDKIFERIKTDSTRPLLQKDDPKKALEELYLKRKKYYEKADFKIDASREASEIAEEIYEKING